MSKIAAICVAYGCDFKNRGKGKKSDKVVIFFEKKSSLEKVFNQVRFDGSNLLRKRFFAKVVSAESKKKSTGCAEVVVSVNTPMRFDYVYSTSKLSVTFYIHRYDKNEFAVDASLQRMVNSIQVDEE